jgi:hypothetical protein
MARRYHHHVYVVALSPDVLYEPRFRRANPDYVTGKPCVYVGMTGLTPDVRFDKHKAGIQANKFAQEYGLRLMPELYAVYNPMPYRGAAEMEVELAIALREAGYGVWQA